MIYFEATGDLIIGVGMRRTLAFAASMASLYLAACVGSSRAAGRGHAMEVHGPGRCVRLVALATEMLPPEVRQLLPDTTVLRLLQDYSQLGQDLHVAQLLYASPRARLASAHWKQSAGLDSLLLIFSGGLSVVTIRLATGADSMLGMAHYADEFLPIPKPVSEARAVFEACPYVGAKPGDIPR